MKPTIEFKDVRKRFGERIVLDGLSFSVNRGELFVIVGASGTGKSVVLKHVVGLLEPDSGTVSVETRRVGYLFQSGALLAWMTIGENVALPLRETTRLSEEKIGERVTAALAAVGLAEDADKYPSEVSGGMLKRAGLARAIVRAAETVLYDEPTSGLDPVTAARINALIVKLNRERGITSVLVTHDLGAALEMADRILLLKDGRAVECAPPGEFAKSEDQHVREFLAAAKGVG